MFQARFQRLALTGVRTYHRTHVSSALTHVKSTSSSRASTSRIHKPEVKRSFCAVGSVLGSGNETKSETFDVNQGWDDILKSLEGDDFNIFKIPYALNNLSKLDIDKFEADARFEELVKKLGSNEVTRLSSMSVLASLKALESFPSSDSKTFAVKNLRNTILWQARSASIRDLALVLSFFHARATPENESDQKLLREIIMSLERRWIEIKDAVVLVKVLHYQHCFSDHFINKLCDRVMENAEHMDVDELLMILEKLGQRKIRNVPLLKSLTYFLSKKAKDLEAKDISDCLFALNSLHYKDPNVLGSLCQALDPSQLPSKSSSVIRSILTSLGQLKLRNTELLDQISKWLVDNKDQLSPKDLVAFLLTTASLNYVPQHSEPLYQMISDTLTLETCGDQVWLDVVWSLSVLQKQTEAQLSSVLSPDFHAKLTANTGDTKGTGPVLKVLNLNAVAHYDAVSYKGPVIKVEDEPLIHDVKASWNSAKTKLNETVLSLLANLAATPTHCLNNVNTGMGFILDAEFIMDKTTLKPIPMKDHSAFAIESKQLPKGVQRVALMTISFHESLVNEEQELPGLHSLYKRLLEARGFKVMIVRYNDLKPKQAKIEHVRHLDRQLKALLGE